MGGGGGGGGNLRGPGGYTGATEEPWARGQIHGGSMGPVGSMVVSGVHVEPQGHGSVGSSSRLLGTIGVHGGRGGVCAGIWGHG